MEGSTVSLPSAPRSWTLLAPMRSIPNRIAACITVLALGTVLLWSSRPMSGSWEYSMGRGSRPSLRHPVTFQGFGGPEGWGRWTTDNQATLTFGRALPRAFIAVVRSHAFGPNIGSPVRICAGSSCTTATLAANDTDTSLSFTTPGGTHRLTFHIPYPTVPGPADSRALGIGVVAVRILETSR